MTCHLHTGLSPEKNDIRRGWLYDLSVGLDIITLSQGALDEIAGVEYAYRRLKGQKKHFGRVFGADKETIEQGLIDTARPLYPTLDIRPSLGEIVESLNFYLEIICTNSAKKLGALDLDFSCCYEDSIIILISCLKMLTRPDFAGRVIFTFPVGRASGGKHYFTLEESLLNLKQRLSKGWTIVKTTPYIRHDCDDRQWKIRGKMCRVELKCSVNKLNRRERDIP